MPFSRPWLPPMDNKVHLHYPRLRQCRFHAPNKHDSNRCWCVFPGVRPSGVAVRPRLPNCRSGGDALQCYDLPSSENEAGAAVTRYSSQRGCSPNTKATAHDQPCRLSRVADTDCRHVLFSGARKTIPDSCSALSLWGRCASWVSQDDTQHERRPSTLSLQP